MSFTDEDLKQLEAYMENYSAPEMMPFFNALLARLEAAEKFISHWQLSDVDNLSVNEMCEHTEMAKEALEDWRKAAGK